MRPSSGPAALLLLALASCGSRGGRASEVAQAAPAPIAVAGPSWLRTLSISVDETRLGHMGGDGPPPPAARASPFDDAVHRAVVLAGSDDAGARKSLATHVAVDGAEIYRLSCRSCHGPDGRGQPPEVASIVGLARALSPALIEENMRKAGRPARPALARQLAQQAAQSLGERLRDGGKRMPPFRYLSGAEREALTAYLERLGGVPSAPRGPTVAEPAARVGELLVQGTCRICHDATGPGGGHRMLMMGRIPALAAIPDQLSLEAVVHKVRRGWSGMAGMMHHRMSRMPVFSYVTDEEVADAYLFLAYAPPGG